LATSALFEWSWHHFNPLGKAENYLPILEVLGEHEGQLVDSARESVGLEAEALDLGIGLGKRTGEKYPDLFRDRIDVWRFTGALIEPGLVGDEIRLTTLGKALLEDPSRFEQLMFRQALRLSFPRGARARTVTSVDRASEKLEEALEEGPGVNVIRAWSLVCGHLRLHGSDLSLTGEEAARYLSGSASLDEIAERTEALRLDRSGGDSGVPDVTSHKKRQGRELEIWLAESGALGTTKEAHCALDPDDREFSFKDASPAEMLRWNEWWGAIPLEERSVF
jgi:hypothetical protein